MLLQHLSLVRLRTDNASLQQQLQDLRAQNDQLTEAQAGNAEVEKQKLRRAQAELLRLRAEVTNLRDATQNVARSTPSVPAAPIAAAPAVSNPPVVRLQANVRSQVGTGQTLMTGGWTSEPGKRIFLLATPRVQGDNNDQVEIKTKIIELPDAALPKVGLDGFTVEGNDSSVKEVIPPEDVEALLKVLEGIEGVKLLAEQNLVTADGRQAEIRTSAQPASDGGKQNLGPMINIVPVISSDKTAIDMTLQAGMNRPGR